MMDRERPSASDSEGKIPEAWIGQEVMIETTETLSSDLRAAAPVYLEDVNDRGVVMLVTRHKDQSQFSRYFYPGVWLAGYALPRRTSRPPTSSSYSPECGDGAFSEIRTPRSPLGISTLK
jgi:hypothetical protein